MFYRLISEIKFAFQGLLKSLLIQTLFENGYQVYIGLIFYV